MKAIEKQYQCLFRGSKEKLNRNQLNSYIPPAIVFSMNLVNKRLLLNKASTGSRPAHVFSTGTKILTRIP